MASLTLLVNGSEHKVETAPSEPLLYVLRNQLGLTGTKYGCGEGQCGACTVLLDGRPVRSCRTPAQSAAGKRVQTIEPLQRAFLEEEAFQCGYCTPGMIMSGVALLQAKPRPSDEDVLQHMNGNICRCGTYQRIVAAIQRAAGEGAKS
jgi:aerobic-type carbon monoxide dehydrogenase small subunit (CoxS/CutS family)